MMVFEILYYIYIEVLQNKTKAKKIRRNYISTQDTASCGLIYQAELDHNCGLITKTLYNNLTDLLDIQSQLFGQLLFSPLKMCVWSKYPKNVSKVREKYV